MAEVPYFKMVATGAQDAVAQARSKPSKTLGLSLQDKPQPTKQASLGSLDTATATMVATARRVPLMGGIAASTQPGGHGHGEEPDIDMPEPDAPASDDSDSDEAEGNSIYYPSKSKGGRLQSGTFMLGPLWVHLSACGACSQKVLHALLVCISHRQATMQAV